MDLTKTMPAERVELQIAPLIDVVFLLLIYFMVTAALIKQEADIAFLLPAQVQQETPINSPIEVVIDIASSGDVIVEGMVLESTDRELTRLATRLAQLNLSAKNSGSPLIVTVFPKDQVQHHRIIEVMNACAVADVKNISFNLNS